MTLQVQVGGLFSIQLDIFIKHKKETMNATVRCNRGPSHTFVHPPWNLGNPLYALLFCGTRIGSYSRLHSLCQALIAATQMSVERTLA